MNINEIAIPVEKHIKEFEVYFKNRMKSNVALLDLIVKYLTKTKGKQVRPLMVFLTAAVCGEICDKTYSAATMVELLHTATLVHDDVVDESKERRGFATINARWNNKIAVLVGDYLLGKGLLTASEKQETDLLTITAEAVRFMSEGELLQIQKSRESDTSEETYFKIISAKTASLISACCEMGAVSVGADSAEVAAMKNYGQNVGIAFQIQDDIFDYVGSSSIIGKPVGNDLQEKKITLPLIFALNKVDKNKAKEIIKIVKSGKVKKTQIKDIIAFVNQYGGIDYARQTAINYKYNAVENLKMFKDSEAKQSLVKFADFVVDRML